MASLFDGVNFDASLLPEELASRHATFLAAAQRADGGFPGRRGTSDLYYTGFALRGLAMLGRLADEPAHRAAKFLRQQIGRHMSAADFFSLATSSLLVELATGTDVFAVARRDRRQDVAEFFARFRRPDGGYAKTERGTSSTYQTFLVCLCKQLVGAPPDEPGPIVELIRARQRPDGGFSEIDVGIPKGDSPIFGLSVRTGERKLGQSPSGTNPTAAAVAVLRSLAALDDSVRDAAVKFLDGMQTGEGGLRANTRIPVADLLSTFTGLWTLADLGTLAAIDVAAARRFVLSLEQSAGGFRAGGWDREADVEYTFYGLGARALLSYSP
ncbi:MAG: prenyltransferase/squalene oxidase repeat-containing protein [Thermoguttaceae bacterium]